jgi:DNA (cytosine-5)-methyltransferase 1
MGNNEKTGINNGVSVDVPSVTVTTGDRLGLVQCFGIKYHKTGENLPDLNAPSSTMSTKDRIGLVKVFVMTHGWAWSMNPIEKPSPTIIARQDKSPIYLVQVESGEMGIAVFENDSPAMEKIKLFMAAYGIIDIKMRMLTLTEQMAIQGFPKDYILKGTMTERKKYNGNAVEVNQAKANIEAVAIGIINYKTKVA